MRRRSLVFIAPSVQKAKRGYFARAIAVIRLVAPLVVAFGCQTPSLESVQGEVRQAFPDVAQLSTDTLAGWLDDPARPLPQLIDVRESDEYAISHLPGALSQMPGAPVSDEILALDRSTPIVAYCSVGYRSSRFAARLHEAGFTQVFNLEGSIFAWANEGRAVVREGRLVEEVHPYNRRWGRLLDRRHHPEAAVGPAMPAAPTPVEAQ